MWHRSNSRDPKVNNNVTVTQFLLLARSLSIRNDGKEEMPYSVTG